MFFVAVVEYLFTFSLTVASCKHILGNVIFEPLAHVPFFSTGSSVQFIIIY